MTAQTLDEREAADGAADRRVDSNPQTLNPQPYLIPGHPERQATLTAQTLEGREAAGGAADGRIKADGHQGVEGPQGGGAALRHGCRRRPACLRRPRGRPPSHGIGRRHSCGRRALLAPPLGLRAHSRDFEYSNQPLLSRRGAIWLSCVSRLLVPPDCTAKGYRPLYCHTDVDT